LEDNSNLNEQLGKEILKKNQIELLEMKSSISQIKKKKKKTFECLSNRLDQVGERITELKSGSFEIFHSDGKKEKNF
jgi:hypothetical protein